MQDRNQKSSIMVGKQICNMRIKQEGHELIFVERIVSAR